MRRNRLDLLALRAVTLLALTLWSGGCAGTNRPTADADAPPAAQASPSHAPALDASTRTLRVLGLRVYELELPRGRVSGNKELWRRIDEQAVDAAAYDVLYANGVRVGLAPVAEIGHVSESLLGDEAKRIDIVAKSLGRQTQELPVETGIFEKTLFWFDAEKRSKGRTFQRCETLLAVGFGLTPGRQETVRVSVAPVVRSTQPRTVIDSTGGDYQVNLVRDETIFDLKLTADVPLGEFLIVAPSEELRWETSLGRQFFCREEPGELLERVYVIVPQVVAEKQVPPA